jgi:threonine dehydratase
VADDGGPFISGIDGYSYPVSDPAVIAGNGTIGLEIVEDLPTWTRSWCRSAAAG